MGRVDSSGTQTSGDSGEESSWHCRHELWAARSPVQPWSARGFFQARWLPRPAPWLSQRFQEQSIWSAALSRTFTGAVIPGKGIWLASTPALLPGAGAWVWGHTIYLIFSRSTPRPVVKVEVGLRGLICLFLPFFSSFGDMIRPVKLHLVLI